MFLYYFHELIIISAVSIVYSLYQKQQQQGIWYIKITNYNFILIYFTKPQLSDEKQSVMSRTNRFFTIKNILNYFK